MTEMRSRRQRVLAEVLRGGVAASQDELVEALRTEGFAVTQATVSRDLDQLGAVRVRRGGVTRYAMADQVNEGRDAPALDRLRAIVAEWVRSVEPAGQLVVIRTPPGSAHLIGVALDRAALPNAVGTICGDDTLFVATPSTEAASEIARQLRAMAGLA